MKVAAAILFSVLACGFAHGQSFTLVGVPSTATRTTGEGVSADGHYAAGSSDRSDGYKAGWYWTPEGGRVDIQGPGLPTNTNAHGISPEAGWMVGDAGVGGTGPTTAYRYNRLTGAMQTLGNIASHPRSLSTDASIGASTVVGYHETVGGILNRQAFRWTESGGMQLLGSLPGDFYSEAAAVNADGTRIVGVSGTTNGNAFLWTAGMGMTVLPRVPGGSYGRALGINTTGDLIVGYWGLTGTSTTLAVRWRDGIPENLGTAVGYTRSLATAISDDGSVIVGEVSTGSVSTAGIWTPSTGWLRLQDYMQSIGVVIPAGMNLQIANGISADGRTIVGTSFSGHGEGFVITIPSPSVLCFAAGVLLTFRRKR